MEGGREGVPPRIVLPGALQSAQTSVLDWSLFLLEDMMLISVCLAGPRRQEAGLRRQEAGLRLRGSAAAYRFTSPSRRLLSPGRSTAAGPPRVSL